MYIILVLDSAGRDSIPRSMQLIAGRIGQEYNQRKNRKGAFWEDRYHAVTIESGKHLIRCIVYIDLNMVRARVLEHPSEWEFSGFNEIQCPRRKNIIISYEDLLRLAGYSDYETFRKAHAKWVLDSIKKEKTKREVCWTESMAVGSERFIDDIKRRLSIRTRGRQKRPVDHGFELREPSLLYNAISGPEKRNIDGKNA